MTFADVPPPTPEEIRAAIAALSRLTTLDLIPSSFPPTKEPAMSLLERAGPVVVDDLEAALRGATGAGRVALAMTIVSLAPRRGRRIVQALRRDRTPAEINTCLCGFRTVADWARAFSPPAGAASQFAEDWPCAWRLSWVVAVAIVGLIVWLLLA